MVSQLTWLDGDLFTGRSCFDMCMMTYVVAQLALLDLDVFFLKLVIVSGI